MSKTVFAVAVGLFVGIGSTGMCAYVDEVLADNPIAYFRLDEAEIGPIVDEIGNVAGTWDTFGKDPSGLVTGLSGIPSGGTSVQIGTAKTFAEGDNGQGVLDVGGVLDLGLVDTINATLEAWFYLDEGWESTAYARIFHYNNGANGQYAFGVLGNDNAGFAHRQTVFGGSGNGTGADGIILAAQDDDGDDTTGFLTGRDQEWHHLVAVLGEFDVQLYLNGEELQTLEPSDPIFWQGPQATIGGRTQTDGTSHVHPFPGRIDEFAIYNGALSAERISAHYAAGITPGGFIREDINEDGRVDASDAGLLFAAWTGEAPTAAAGDATASYNYVSGLIEISANGVVNAFVESASGGLTPGNADAAPAGLLASDNASRVGLTGFGGINVSNWKSQNTAGLGMDDLSLVVGPALGVPSVTYEAGSNNFTYVPEPASAGLLGIGMLMLLSRRRG